VLSPIITDLQLDKVWAKRFKSGLDAWPMQDALGYMNGLLHLDYKRGTSIITISASGPDAKECAEIANAVADRYKTMRDVAEEQLSNTGIAALRDRISEQEKIVAAQTNKVEQMRQDLYNREHQPAQGKRTRGPLERAPVQQGRLRRAHGSAQADPSAARRPVRQYPGCARARAGRHCQPAHRHFPRADRYDQPAQRRL
jgi:hypothetical protein